MIIGNPVLGFALKVCGLIGIWRDVTASCGDPAKKRDCPFVLVARESDGRWGVFQQDYDNALASFDEMQEACDYANERAKTQAGSMVLIGRRQGLAGNSNSSMAEGAT